ncbi:hypothetical protein LF1_56440 [Rubripirellula obstinata]|uniref:Uncharacterized protein n=1 Tax=Rubripirellula obstinata TaxID=406547 RepID=A0A5B1C9X9_9BACT|nr:hypothetical protein LF1_56440 [Rubripirellula obstinata]
MTCTGVAVVSFSICLQIVCRHPVMSTVIRLNRGHLLPSSRPAGHNQRTTNAQPTHNQRTANTALPRRSTNTQVPTALRGINQRLNYKSRPTPMCRMHCVAPTNACIRALDLLSLAKTCLTNETLLRFKQGDCHLRGRSPR